MYCRNFILPVLVLLSLSLSYVQSTNAEYIVYKNLPEKIRRVMEKNPQMFPGTYTQGRMPLTKQEYDQVYKILMRYQFPMNTIRSILPSYTEQELRAKTVNFAQSDSDKPKIERAIKLMANISKQIGSSAPLSEAEINELKMGEEAFLRAQIKKINPHFDLSFIPTTAYELLTLESFASALRKNEEELDPLISSIKTLSEFARLSSAKGDLELFLQTYVYENYVPEIIEKYFETNNLILEKYYKTEDLQEAALIKLIEELSSIVLSPESRNPLWELTRITRHSGLLPGDFLKEIKIPLRNALLFEYEAHQKNKALLLRGTRAYNNPIYEKRHYTLNEIRAVVPYERQGFIDSTLSQTLERTDDNGFTVKTKPYSDSYGNSLFAGYRDTGATGANAIGYIMKERTVGYALLIDKINYLHPESIERKLFFIPPLSTMVGLLSEGELFHARSRVALCTEVVPGLSGLYEHAELKSAIPRTTSGNFLAFVGSPEEHEINFSNYLVENIRILRNESLIDIGEKEQAPEEPSYFKPEKITEHFFLPELLRNQLKLPEQKYPTEKEFLRCAQAAIQA